MGHAYTVVPEHQADEVLTQANPVSGTLYEVLATTKNVRVISIGTNITWGVTQPTPLEIVVTVDGQTVIFSKTNPVSATAYEAAFESDGGTQLSNYNVAVPMRAFLLEGRSVRIQVRITWAVTQPTPLRVRVVYAKY